MKLVTMAVVVIAILVVVVVGIKSFQMRSHDSGAASIPVVRVTYGTSDVNVIADGTIIPDAVVGVSVLPGMSGTVSRVDANIGDYVHQGQVLAEINPVVQDEDAQTAAYDYQAAKARYYLAAHPVAPSDIRALGIKLRADELAVSDASAKLKLLKAGHLPLEIQSARDTATAANQDLKFAEDNDKREHQLFDKDLITEAELEGADQQLDNAEAAADNADDALALIVAPARSEDITMAANDVAAAKLALQQDSIAYHTAIAGGRPEEIEAAAAAVGQSAVALDRSERILGYQYIRAPISGYIVQRSINPGEIAVPSPARTNVSVPLNSIPNAAFVIADDSPIEFLANMDERFFHFVVRGQKASVGVESLPGREFYGKVVNANSLINTNKLQNNLGGGTNVNSPLTFPVWIRLNNSSHQLVPGQVGIVSLVYRQHGLMIPQEAVNLYSVGSGTVRVVHSHIIRTRSITFDGNSDGSLRVLSGLKPGDFVAVGGTDNIPDGARISIHYATADDLSPKAF